MTENSILFVWIVEDMNFKGLEKFAVIVILMLAAALVVPALILAAWTSPAVLVCVCAAIGVGFGVWLKDVRWSITMGSAGSVAALTLLYVSAALGGGVLAWLAAFVATVLSTSLTILFGFLCVPK
ncbi:MAG: hypothetical protein K2W95_25485 [Candidatus Obscuribacterales bacterium]|nr:hypothetical protein [Candidatus Obscuribacterales bacterium]